MDYLKSTTPEDLIWFIMWIYGLILIVALVILRAGILVAEIRSDVSRGGWHWGATEASVTALIRGQQ
jgi:hypothetical protein